MRLSLVGMCFLFIGSTFLFLSLQYDFGSLSKIKSGFFPTIISSILCICGAILIKKENHTFYIDKNILFWIFLSILCFCIFTYLFNMYVGVIFMGICYFYGFRNT